MRELKERWFRFLAIYVGKLGVEGKAIRFVLQSVFLHDTEWENAKESTRRLTA